MMAVENGKLGEESVRKDKLVDVSGSSSGHLTLRKSLPTLHRSFGGDAVPRRGFDEFL